MGKIVGTFVKAAFVLLLFFPFSSGVVSAHHQSQVLGDTTAIITEPSIPPTNEGPGLILPDSPLFFLDRIKQNVRLFLAFSPEDKVKIHAAVAGERLAELQLMLLKNNVSAVRTSLQGVSDNLKRASDDLDTAKLTGRNISLLAKSINDSIKDKREKLSILEKQANGELKKQVQATKEALKVTKVEVEDHLSADLLESEMEDDLNQEVEDRVDEASSSAKGLTHAVDVLTRLASQAAQKDQAHREEALLRAIEVKNETLRKQQEKLLEKQKEKQKNILKLHEKATQEAKKSANSALEAAQNFREAQKKITEIKTTSSSGSGSSISENSGSSGSGISGSSGTSGSGESGASGKD